MRLFVLHLLDAVDREGALRRLLVPPYELGRMDEHATRAAGGSRMVPWNGSMISTINFTMDAVATEEQDPLSVLRPEMKLLLIEQNLLRTELEQRRAIQSRSNVAGQVLR